MKLAKDLAGGMKRREAFRRIGGGLAGCAARVVRRGEGPCQSTAGSLVRPRFWPAGTATKLIALSRGGKGGCALPVAKCAMRAPVGRSLLHRSRALCARVTDLLRLLRHGRAGVRLCSQRRYGMRGRLRPARHVAADCPTGWFCLTLCVSIMLLRCSVPYPPLCVRCAGVFCSLSSKKLASLWRSDCLGAQK